MWRKPPSITSINSDSIWTGIATRMGSVISQGDCRMFLTNAPFRQNEGNSATVIVWLNLESKPEADELYPRCREAGATSLAEPEDKPWNLREFRVADPERNEYRVLYDFNWELQQKQA